MEFLNRKLEKLIAAAAAVIVLEHILVLTDGAIAGRVLGPSALAAMSLIFPMFSAVTLISILFAFGISYLRVNAVERSDGAMAARLVRQGTIGAVVIAFVLLGFATLVEYPYLNFFSPNDATLVLFDEYWGWFSLVILFKVICGVVLCLVFTDGARRLATVAYVVHILANLLFASLFCTGFGFLPDLGMEGISLGTVLAYAVGIVILTRHFFDREHCGLKFTYKAPEPVEPAPVSDRYEVLRGSQMTLDDLDGVIELDRLSLDSCYQVTADDDYALFKDNPENGLIIRDRETRKIVGYSMLLPIRDDMYEKIKSGTFVDTDFKSEMTFRYDHPGVYHLYFASIVVHPEHRSAALVLTMLDAMVQDFIMLAEKRNIWFEDMIADVVSTDGAKFCRLFGLKKVSVTNHDSVIYEVKGFPPGVRVTTPATRRLVELYQQKYESL